MSMVSHVRPRDSHMKKLGILIISLRDKNQGFPVSLKVFMTERHYIFSFQSIILGCVLISGLNFDRPLESRRLASG